MLEPERRSILSMPTNDGNRLVGYGAVFNSPARVTQGNRSFTEIVRKGAFATAVQSRGDVLASFNHDPLNHLLGRISSGTLRLAEDEHGLRYEIDLPDTQDARDIKALIARGDIRGSSFSFGVRKNGEVWTGETRELTDLYLHELGPVVMPVYDSTSVGIRSRIPFMKLHLELRSKF